MNGIKIIANNKRAGYDFEIIEKFETGIVLVGTEVKSLRLGKCSLSESTSPLINLMKRGSTTLISLIMNLATSTIMKKVENANSCQEKELNYLQHKSRAQGMTIIPTKIYFKNLWSNSRSLWRGKEAP